MTDAGELTDKIDFISSYEWLKEHDKLVLGRKVHIKRNIRWVTDNLKRRGIRYVNCGIGRFADRPLDERTPFTKEGEMMEDASSQYGAMPTYNIYAVRTLYVPKSGSMKNSVKIIIAGSLYLHPIYAQPMWSPRCKDCIQCESKKDFINSLSKGFPETSFWQPNMKIYNTIRPAAGATA